VTIEEVEDEAESAEAKSGVSEAFKAKSVDVPPIPLSVTLT
jgi:hypothetical protein